MIVNKYAILTLKYVRRKTTAATATQYNIVNATKTTVYPVVQFLILTHTAESNDNVYPSSHWFSLFDDTHYQHHNRKSCNN